MKKRYVLSILIFLLAVVFTAAMVGCNDKSEDTPDSPAEETVEVRYSSMKGDVLVLSNGNYVLTLADGGRYEGKYSGQGKALVLSTAGGDLFVSLDGGSLFSLLEMNGSGEIIPTKPTPGCAHENVALVGYVAPECEKEGFSGKRVCLDCGVTVTPGTAIQPKGHHYSAESDIVCEKGYCTRNETHYYACSECGKVSSDPEDTYEIPNSANGQHSFTAISDVVCKAATCSENQRNYAACSVCGEVGTFDVPVPGTATGAHDYSVKSTKKLYSEADCGHNARYFYACSVCGQVSINPNDTYEAENTATGEHRFTEPSGDVKREATCACDRIEYGRCAVCGLVNEDYEVSVPGTKTNVHVFTEPSDVVAKKATCTTDRYVYSKCQICGAIGRDRTVRVMATATGHTYVDHVCTDCGVIDPDYYATYNVSANKNTDNVGAYLYRSGLDFDLLIIGTGNMESYATSADAPWAGQNVKEAFVYGNIVKLGDYTFADLPMLSSIKFVSDVERFGNYAFYGCDSLTSVTLPTSTQRLGVGAFAHCAALTSVNFGDLTGLSSVGNNLFRGDTSLTSVSLTNTALTVLPQEMFSECLSLSSVALPTGLEEIGDYAFYCTSIASIAFPASLHKIGARAFSDCTYLAGIDLSVAHLQSVGDYAFAGADLLSSFSICGGITEIGKDVLAGTAYYNNLNSWTGGLMYLNGSYVKEYLMDALQEDTYFKVTAQAGDNPLEKGWYKRVDTGVYYPSMDAFCRGGAEYYEYLPDENRYVRVDGHVGDVPLGKWYQQKTEYIEATETTCGTIAYYKKADPVSGSLTLASATKVVANGALEDCILVSAVNLGGTQYVGKNAFRHCMSLGSVRFDSARVIGEGAFYSCGKLTSVALPASVTSVGGSAFAKCTLLRSFSYRSGAELASDVLEGANLFEVYRPTAVSASFGAVVVHTDAYSEQSTLVSDDTDTFLFAQDASGAWALVGCLKPELTSLVLPDSFSYNGASVTSYSVFERAFYYEDYHAQFTTVTLSSAVTSIGKEAFFGCGELSSLSVPLSVDGIGEGILKGTAYYENEINWQNGYLYLTSSEKVGNEERYFLLTVQPGVGIRLSDAVVKDRTVVIADNAFALCADVKTLVLPATLRSVGKNLLVGCPQITSLTVPYVGKTSDPDGEGSFLSYLFGGESYMDNASLLPESLTSITVTTATIMPAYALYSCSGLKTISVSRASEYRAYALYGCENATVTASAEIVTVGEYAFYNCIGLGAVSLSSSMTTISDYAFYHTGLRTLAVQSRTTSVGRYAFSESPYLYSVVLGASLTSVGTGAFQNCLNLIQVTVGEAMVAGGIQENAFFGCKKLVEVLNKSVQLQQTQLSAASTDNGYLTYYSKRVVSSSSPTSLIVSRDDFRMCYFGETYYLLAYVGTAASVSLPESYNATVQNYKIYPYAFAGNLRLTRVVMSPAAVEIGQYAFMDCASLTQITLSTGAHLIDKGAFYRTGLTGVSLPTSVINIGESAFENCADLTEVVFGAGVENIGRYAFRGCVKLNSVSLSSSVRAIGEEAFAGCVSARTLSVRQNVTTVGNRAFADCAILNRVEWSSFVQLREDSKIFERSGQDSFGITAYFTSIATVPDYFFDTGSVSTAPNVVGLSFGSTVTRIGSYAFRNLFVSVLDFPTALLEIGDFAFANCRVSTLVLPDSVTAVGAGAFKDCAFLNNVSLSSGMTALSAGLFEGCRGIVSIALPKSVRQIGENAFLNCQELQNVALFGSVTAVGNNAFSGCGKLYNDGNTKNGYLFVMGASTFSATVGTGNEALSSAQKRFVYFDEENYAVYVGSNGQNMINFRTSTGGLYDPYSISYESSDLSKVSVAYSSGSLTGQAYGSAVITATITFVIGLQAKMSYIVTVI